MLLAGLKALPTPFKAGMIVCGSAKYRLVLSGEAGWGCGAKALPTPFEVGMIMIVRGVVQFCGA
jgi:hypothetical protein